MILIWNNFSWIAESFEFISMVQVQKKGLPQAIARWRGGLITKIHSAVDANDFIQMIQGMGAMVVIPARSNRNQQRNQQPESDLHWY